MNKRLMHIIAFSLSLLFMIQVYINVKLLYEENLSKLSSITTVIPVVSKNSKIYGFKDILELSEENKSIKIVKLGINPEDKTKVNVEIEYNGAKDSLNDILRLVSSKENLWSINNISLISTDEFKVKAIVNMDFIKNK
jgi:hypothetical protein